MTSTNTIPLKFTTIRKKIIKVYSTNTWLVNLLKSLAISGLILYLLYVLLYNHPCCRTSKLLATHKWLNSNTIFSLSEERSTTDLSHVVFGIAGSSNTWYTKRAYIESWWRPNVTRGFLFLDRPPTMFLPWAPSSPPFRISENTSRFKEYDKHAMPFAIRMVRVISETFREERENVRWYVMADDDTVLFIDNLVEVLRKYDHTKFFYVGSNSECVASNADHSFQMAFGGAGYALSYPLAEAVAKNLDECLKRYPTLFGSDHILQSCIADLGVSLTYEKGFHQIDLHNDLSGFLSSHPQTPFLSLHHLDVTDPLFPTMNRYDSVNHLMKAGKIDQYRLLQQSICYHKPTNWSFSIAWGYSVYIYEQIIPPSFLRKPLQTFSPWRRAHGPPYMFNFRFYQHTPCDAPHAFFMQTINKTNEEIVVNYVRRFQRRLPPCSFSGNHSADSISEIRVFSPTTKFDWVGAGSRRECCDITHTAGTNVTEVRFRHCVKNELTR